MRTPPPAPRWAQRGSEPGLRKPGSGAARRAVTAISLGPSSRTAANDLPEDLGAGRAILLFGLPPGGVCRAGLVTQAAVSSYLAVSPLPSPASWPSGGLFSVALSLSSRTVGVTHHLALGSPDFPPAAHAAGGRPETRQAERRRPRAWVCTSSRKSRPPRQLRRPRKAASRAGTQALAGIGPAALRSTAQPWETRQNDRLILVPQT